MKRTKLKASSIIASLRSSWRVPIAFSALWLSAQRQVCRSSSYPSSRALLRHPEGPSVDATQSVIANLMISRMEYRSDESIDVKQYIKDKTIEIIKVPLG